jgi:SAM-dependent methyltransferase
VHYGHRVSDANRREAELASLIALRRDPPLAVVPRWRRPLTRFVRRLGRTAGAHQAHIDAALAAWLAETSAGLASQSAELAAQAAGLAAQAEAVAQLGPRLDAVEAATGRLDVAAAGLGNEIGRLRELVAADQDYGQAFLHEFDAGLGGRVLGFRELPEASDGIYLGFEDLFRGSEQEITERQRAYLPLLQGREPVLDVGCGRGELLELLRDAGAAASGVDIDADMVSRCHEKGLEVREGDAVAELEGAASGSLGAIVAAQVIEHLPYELLLRFLYAAQTALRPGGRLILETVNPHSAQARKNFWIDPTHRHPLFPETVLALCHLTGYGSAFVWHPQGTGEPDQDRASQPDYAVVADTGAGELPRSGSR